MGLTWVDPEGRIQQLEQALQHRDEEVKILREAVDKKNQTIKELEADARHSNLAISAIKAILATLED